MQISVPVMEGRATKRSLFLKLRGEGGGGRESKRKDQNRPRIRPIGALDGRNKGGGGTLWEGMKNRTVPKSAEWGALRKRGVKNGQNLRGKRKGGRGGVRCGPTEIKVGNERG